MNDRMPERKNSIEIYRTSDNQAEVEVKFDKDTVWLNQYQMAELFEMGCPVPPMGNAKNSRLFDKGICYK